MWLGKKKRRTGALQELLSRGNPAQKIFTEALERKIVTNGYVRED